MTQAIATCPDAPTSRRDTTPRLAGFDGRYAIRLLLRRALQTAIAAHLPTTVDTLVDLGSGDAPHRALFDGRCRRYVTVDLVPDADVQFSADGDAPLPDTVADVVLSTQVLEHVEDVEQYLRTCRRLLPPRGILLLSTHGTWKHHPHPCDLHRWTAEGLGRLLATHGFEVRELRGVMGLAPTGLLLLQDALVMKLPRLLRRPVAAMCQPLLLGFDRLHSDAERQRDAAVYLAVAERMDA